jgi:hypothetical protein
MTTTVSTSTVSSRRALEALRNGVPNRDAVRELDSGQQTATQRFLTQLDQGAELFSAGRQAPGMLIEGGFGSGKSHLLQYFEHLTLEQNFVCSRIAVSKETPLYDPGKVYRAAIDATVVPGGVNGHAVQEIAQRLDTRGQAYADFYHWAGAPESGLAQLFAASLKVHERASDDPDRAGSITGFWSGDSIKVADLRRWLKEAGLTSAFAVTAVAAKDLALQRFHFAAHLFNAVGYRGWVLLIDELEMIGKYGVVSRGKSYGELARWLGEVSGEQYPGITTVAAVTDDFATALLSEKHDKDLVPAKLEMKGTDEARAQARRAETGMRIIEHGRFLLDPPDGERLRATYQRLREIHAEAYKWNPPELPSGTIANGHVPAHRRLRSYVRQWIHEWDLQRLYPDTTAETQVDEVRMDYGEDADLESASGTGGV